MEKLTAFKLQDGSVEALKWLALALMLIDHTNKYAFDHALPAAYELGRLAMPIFGFVLGFNLARPGAFESGTYQRIMLRLCMYGLIATPCYALLNARLGAVLGGLWPLNILFTLLVAVAVLFLHQKGKWSGYAAIAVFCVGGALVEYWYFGIACTITAWMFCKTPNVKTLLTWAATIALLGLVNRNYWALGAIPIILGASYMKVHIQRHPRVFYSFYPMHLAAILLCLFTLGRT